MGCEKPRHDWILQCSEEAEKKFEGLELHHVPRLKNQAADELAKIGSTRRPMPSNVCLEHLHTPSMQEDPFTEEPRNLQVLLIRLKSMFQQSLI